MDYRTLGLSGLRVSSIGLGCMGMSHAYGAPADRREMAELLADAVDMGYTFFDTATDYRASMPQFHKGSFRQNKALFRIRGLFIPTPLIWNKIIDYYNKTLHRSSNRVNRSSLGWSYSSTISCCHVV